MKERIFMVFPPFYRYDAVQQLDDLGHTAICDKVIDPFDSFVPEQLPELVNSTNFDLLRILHFPEVGNTVIWRCKHVGPQRPAPARTAYNKGSARLRSL